MRTTVKAAVRLALVVALVPAAAAPEPASRRTRNVLVVTLDGLRWQELFGGFQAELNTKEEGGVRDPGALARRFDRPDAGARREALLPFFWGTVAREGQVLGDPSRGSRVRVTNGLWFSYPGYSEMLAGFADPRVDSNDKRDNPNLTVLEWLARQPGFEGRVAAFGSWDVLPFIVAASRSGLAVNGDGAAVRDAKTGRERLLNDLTEDLPVYWGGVRFDAPTVHGAIEHLRSARPRVLYVMLGETDEWAHDRRYDLYLDSAARSDRMVRRLWEAAQAIPEYRGTTALVLSTDHGRGDSPRDWTEHGQKVPAAERIWMAVMGPDTPARGARAGSSATQSQLAATVAALLGLDYRAAAPAAAPPLEDLATP